MEGETKSDQQLLPQCFDQSSLSAITCGAEGGAESVAQPETGFESEALLPSQLLGRKALSKKGEYRLALAVLKDAIECFQKYSCARDGRGRRLFCEAESWLLTEHAPASDTAAFTFEHICNFLDLDIGYLRHGLRRWREAHSHPAKRHQPP